MVEVVFAVVGNVKIRPTVIVVIADCAAVAPAVVSYASRSRHVSEGTVPVIAVKAVLTKVGAEDIVEAVVVVVADTHTIGPANRFQSRLLRHISKRAVAVVLVQTIGRFGRVAFKSRA